MAGAKSTGHLFAISCFIASAVCGSSPRGATESAISA
jgi:hypothetical protein